MSAALKPKNSSSSSRSAGTRRTDFYLRPRTKVWALALCFGLMIGASFGRAATGATGPNGHVMAREHFVSP